LWHLTSWGKQEGDDVLKGFRDFVFRGNIIDLSVAFVIGVAFTALIQAFTRSFIEPLIRLFLGGGVDGGKVTLRGQTFDFGGFINAVITFLITAAVLYFLVVMPTQTIMDRIRRGEPDTPAPPPSEEAQLLAEIRDLLRQQAPPPRA
jgi:large conductance mechanosensitive channel